MGFLFSLQRKRVSLHGNLSLRSLVLDQAYNYNRHRSYVSRAHDRWRKKPFVWLFCSLNAVWKRFLWSGTFPGLLGDMRGTWQPRFIHCARVNSKDGVWCWVSSRMCEQVTATTLLSTLNDVLLSGVPRWNEYHQNYHKTWNKNKRQTFQIPTFQRLKH